MPLRAQLMDAAGISGLSPRDGTFVQPADIDIIVSALEAPSPAPSLMASRARPSLLSPGAVRMEAPWKPIEAAEEEARDDEW